jgi:hypothetical protein
MKTKVKSARYWVVCKDKEVPNDTWGFSGANLQGCSEGFTTKTAATEALKNIRAEKGLWFRYKLVRSIKAPQD